MDLYNSLGIFFGELNRDRTILYRDSALYLARKLKLKIDEADILVGQGYVYLTQKNYPKSFNCLTEALNIVQDSNNSANPFRLNGGQTIMVNRLSTMAADYFVLGNLYDATNNPDKEIQSYQNLIHIAESIRDTIVLTYAYYTLGAFYLKQDNLDSASFFTHKSLGFFSLLKREGDFKYKPIAWLVDAEVNYKKGNLNSARDPLLKAIRFSIEKNNFQSLADTYIAISELYRSQNKLDSSLYYAKAGLKSYSVVKSLQGKTEASDLLSSI